jgi:hypothetical protein
MGQSLLSTISHRIVITAILLYESRGIIQHLKPLITILRSLGQEHIVLRLTVETGVACQETGVNAG